MIEAQLFSLREFSDMAGIDRGVLRDGVRLVCRDWGGSGIPVVLLHGLAGHIGEWDHLAEKLSPRYRVVAVDQRGHGRSERHPPEVTRAAFVEDIVAVADQLELERPVVVGQSMGGHAAMLVAAAHPDLVRALVMIEAGPGIAGSDAPSKIGAWLDSWPTPFPNREAAVEYFGGGALGRGWADGLEERDGKWWPRFERDVMAAVIAEIADRSYWPEWAGISCPVLVVLAQSSFISAPDVDRMLRDRPETVAVSVPGTGHDLHLQQPDSLHAAISDFLAPLV